ncbi:hypothetical protein C8R41DRAFT_915363 [Lentinula lateritia]|uniref:Peroxin domain-containing protein n=1 Tax=Lentinula lateritia TaxID=40482 RepID=A0ABQ8VYL6_9AGAR|nr:hypothetical protein C8R41DRAFT_915363 [Lentinula lateritia]
MDTDEQAPEEFSEEQLRRLYDEEEVSRFLHLFAAHVTEVQLPESTPVGTQNVTTSDRWPKETSGTVENLNGEVEPNFNPSEDKQTLSEGIAFRYILPLLPPPPLPPPPFSLGRLRLATQRLYLSTWPVYVPFFHHLVALCTWRDRRRSARYCMIFWVLWYYNLLLPTFFLRIFYALIRRKIFTYPTLMELKQRRKQVDKANELGEEISLRLSTSSFGLKEIWRISRIFTKSNRNKSTQKSNIGLDKPNGGVDDPTVLDNTKESQKETDVKRAVLLAMNDVADLHERIKNIFIWRRPASSRVYGTALCFCCILTLLLPAQYIAKLVYFLGGAFFWHIIPILAALPSEDRARIPPAFQDVPTDAEFAMEVISRRIAAGLDVNPSKRSSQQSRPSPVALGEIKTDDATSSSAPTTPGGNKPEKGKDVDWKKWGERAAIGKAWIADKKLVSKKPDTSNIDISAAASQPSLLPDAPLPSSGTHTFPCQHTSSPGLLTFTQDMLFFNPIASTRTKVAIPLADIRAVKKTGLLKGLTVKWIDATNDEHKEEVFPWVGGRDEIFARLIGIDVKRWMKV